MGQFGVCILVLTLFGFYASAEESYKCDFENGICPFLKNFNYEENSAKWILGNGRKNIGDTGPSSDHTLKNVNGNYLFVNLTATKTTRVEIETISLNDHYCLRFFYHMYGASVPTFGLYTELSGDQTDDTYYVQSRTQGDQWKEVEIYMNPTSGMKNKRYKVIFGVSNLKYTRARGDVALDDIELTPGKCPDKKFEADALCTFDNSDCGYNPYGNTPSQWIWRNQTRDYSGFKKQPMYDHTLNTHFGGYWITGIGSSKSEPDHVTTLLESPEYAPPGTSLNCLHFYVYMDGEGSGFIWRHEDTVVLSVFINTFDGTSNEQSKSIVSVSKTQHREWTQVKADVNITGKFQLRFATLLKSTAEAFIAIDDVRLFPGNCPEPRFCDFEEDKCTWSDGDHDWYNWIRKTGRSRTNGEIGPDSDHTIGSSDGSYVVFNTRGKNAGSQAALLGEFLERDEYPLCLSFFYQIRGNDLGSLKVLRKESQFTEFQLWLLTGDQGSTWKKGVVELKDTEYYSPGSQVAFRGEIGKGKDGFIALDDIRILKEGKCDLTPPEADPNLPEPDTTERIKESTTTSRPECDCGENSEYCYLDGSTKVCICKEGYAQRDQTCAGTCFRNTDCQNGGACRRSDDTSPPSWFCECRPGFRGDLCERNGHCDGRWWDEMCRVEGAHCSGVGKEAKCECMPGKTYVARWPRCEDECDPDKCLHGTCQKIGKSYKCKCDEGFVGKYCDERKADIPGYAFLWVYIVLFNVSAIFLIVAACLYCKSKRNKEKVSSSRISKVI